MCWDKLTLLTNMTRYPIIFGTFDKVLESIATFKTKSAVFYISWEENKSQNNFWYFLKESVRLNKKDHQNGDHGQNCRDRARNRKNSKKQR